MSATAAYEVFVPGYRGQVVPNTAIAAQPIVGALFQVTAASAAAALAVITGTQVGTNRADASHAWLASNETTS